jgi:hypothetical protein
LSCAGFDEVAVFHGRMEFLSEIMEWMMMMMMMMMMIISVLWDLPKGIRTC